jgi:hypothetical protein
VLTYVEGGREQYYTSVGNVIVAHMIYGSGVELALRRVGDGYQWTSLRTIAAETKTNDIIDGQ